MFKKKTWAATCVLQTMEYPQLLAKEYFCMYSVST